MEDFLITLYEIENFTTYMSIAISALVVLFFLVLFMGKKDQKLEETKRLQKIELEGFKDTSTSVPLEVPVSNDVAVDNAANQIMNSMIQNFPEGNNQDQESTLSTLQELTNGNLVVPQVNVEKQIPVVEQVLPVVMQDESSEPISLSDIATPVENVELPKFKVTENNAESSNESATILNNNFNGIDNAMNNNMFNQNFVEPQMTRNFDEIPAPTPMAMPIFSEAPLMEKNEELIVNEVSEKKQSFGQPIFSSVYVNSKPEVENIIDLTHVGVESDEKTVVKTPSFNDIFGETYDIK